MTSKFFSKDVPTFRDWANKNGWSFEYNEDDLRANFVEPKKNKMHGLVTYLSNNNILPEVDVAALCEKFEYSKKYGCVTLLPSVDQVLEVESFYLDTLELTTAQLVAAFQQPTETGTETSKHRFEWQLVVGENMYSIYDWKNEDGTFDDFENCTWHIAGLQKSKSAKDIANIVNYVSNMQSDTPVTHEDKLTQLFGDLSDLAIDDENEDFDAPEN